MLNKQNVEKISLKKFNFSEKVRKVRREKVRFQNWFIGISLFLRGQPPPPPPPPPPHTKAV